MTKKIVKLIIYLEINVILNFSQKQEYILEILLIKNVVLMKNISM